MIEKESGTEEETLSRFVAARTRLTVVEKGVEPFRQAGVLF
jgi:hypothetical protein